MAVMRKHKQIDQGSSALVSSLGLCDPHSGPTSAPTVLSTLIETKRTDHNSQGCDRMDALT